jgi:hypothetical protein
VNEWQAVWLGTIAVALVVMTVVQIVVLAGALRVGRDLLETSQALRREIKPLVDKAQRVSDDAGKVTALALTQLERIDRMLASTTVRVDETLTLVQSAIVQPVRQGAALFAALRAVASGLRSVADRSSHHREEDDALFVG